LGSSIPAHHHHRRAAATRVCLSPAMLRVMMLLLVVHSGRLSHILPITNLTSRTVAVVSHHDHGDSEHYRSCWRILIRPYDDMKMKSELWFGTSTTTTFQSLSWGRAKFSGLKDWQRWLVILCRPHGIVFTYCGSMT
jgi:hypothetical protein